MNAPDDFDLEAVERRLAARADLAAPAGYRDRVLAAVRDTLEEKVPATKSGRSPQISSPASPDLVAGTFLGFLGIDPGSTAALVAMAFSALVAVVAPWLGLAGGFDPLPAEPRIVMQARAAGIDLQVAAIATTSGPTGSDPSSAPLPDLLGRRHEAWRRRNLLTGEL